MSELTKFDKFISENCAKSPYVWSKGEVRDSIEIWFDMLIDRWETIGVPPFITDFVDTSDIDRFNIYLISKTGTKDLDANKRGNSAQD